MKDIMKKIGIIVDGEGDYRSLKRKYNFKVLITDGPRGEYAVVADIILKARKQISMLRGFGCNKIIIMLDLENRNVVHSAFISQLYSQLPKYDYQDLVWFAVPNKMIENWYLADIEHLSKKKKYLKQKLQQKKYEGLHGKRELKKLFENGYSYSETEHGPELFNLIRESVVAKNSPSFLTFKELISN